MFGLCLPYVPAYVLLMIGLYPSSVQPLPNIYTSYQKHDAIEEHEEDLCI